MTNSSPDTMWTARPSQTGQIRIGDDKGCVCAHESHHHRRVEVAAGQLSADADPFAVACALDWLLYDFLMAHRDGPDSAAIVLGKGQEADAELIVAATAASVAARAMVDPGLVLRV